MSLEVYFDNQLMDEKYYSGLTNNNELFNESFKLGATACNQFKLSMGKEGVTTQPSVVQIRDDGNTIATLSVDNIEEKDYEYVYTLTDKMVSLNFPYDASEIFVNGTTTLYNIALDICTRVGLQLGTTNFRGYDKNISWYDNTRTAREYIGMIAELNGGFARIDGNTLYFIKQNMQPVKTIDIDDCENFNIGEYHKITKVVYELGALKYEYGDETGNTLYLDPDNVYITQQNEVQDIYLDVKDFEFYSFTTTNCPIDYNVKAGDVIIFTDGENEYPTIAQYDLDYFGGWIGGYNLEVNTKQEEETQIIGEKEHIRDLKIIVDRQNNTITQVVSEVGEQNTKISQTQQSVNELNSKIQDIADITTQAETLYAKLNFTDINQSEPIEIKIHPVIGSSGGSVPLPIPIHIAYLHPTTYLYPSEYNYILSTSNLYIKNRIIRFTNTSTNEVFDYELPDDLLINNVDEIYDEFYLGYDQQICQITKRCGYNADGTVYTLDEEVVNTYPYPSIQLTDGDYTVELPGYSYGYMSVRLMAQNIYTTQFATKAELSSSITQTASEINLRVDEKLDEEDFTSANIMLKINNDESSAKINADKVDIAANDVLNLLAGNTINLQSKDITISSDLLRLDKNGMRFYYNNYLVGNIGTSDVVGDSSKRGMLMSITPNSYYIGLGMQESGSDENTNQIFVFYNRPTTYHDNAIQIGNPNWNTMVTVHHDLFAYGYVSAEDIINRSLEELKENIEEYNEEAIKEVMKTKIYEYKLKSQKGKGKKHIGIIINEKNNFSNKIVNEGKDGVELYSMLSVLWKAVQEQQEQIEQLKEEINKLKGEER